MSSAFFDRQPPALPFAAALAVHLFALLAVGFALEPQPPPAATLEVTLARTPADAPPEQADYLAAIDQRGSGDARHRRLLRTDQVPSLDDVRFRDVDPLAHPQPAQAGAAAEIPQVVAAAGGAASAPSPAAPRPGEAADNQPQRVREIASLRAKLAENRQRLSRLPRTLVLTAASARRADHAEYLRRWVEWVERVGNDNYPEEARRRHLYGQLRLAVTVDRTGGVVGVEILESSGQRVLDQAAIRIVRLASPFAPIPPSVAEDRITVIRTWRFVPGHRLTTTAE
ncbi:MAG: transporter TonB [Porticoccaceae bacterium]|nr:MAG: transporter TonB [Porticoccaceae bacterium]